MKPKNMTAAIVLKVTHADSLPCKTGMNIFTPATLEH